MDGRQAGRIEVGVSGAWPPPSREMLLERRTLDYIGARVGDTLVVEARDGRQRPMRIAGTTYDLNTPPPELTGVAFGYITLDTLEWLGGERKFTQLDVRVASDALNAQTIRHVADRVAAKVVGVVLGVITGPVLYANQPYLAYLTRDVGRAASGQLVS
jgi:hypothetical protein